MMKTKINRSNFNKRIEFLFKKNKVTYLKGKGVLFSTTNVIVYDKCKKNYETKTRYSNSHHPYLPGIDINEKYNFIYCGSLTKLVPKSLVIIGGGYIGLEMGSVWKRLGSVIENLPFITPGMD